MIYQSDAELQVACEEWQKRLRLQDWDVKCKIVRARDMNLDDVGAEVSWNLNGKQASIRVLDPVDYPDTQWKQDMEDSLVHELLHLHCAPFDTWERDAPENTALEQMIVSVAGCLVSSKALSK